MAASTRARYLDSNPAPKGRRMGMQEGFGGGQGRTWHHLGSGTRMLRRALRHPDTPCTCRGEPLRGADDSCKSCVGIHCCGMVLTK